MPVLPVSLLAGACPGATSWARGGCVQAGVAAPCTCLCSLCPDGPRAPARPFPGLEARVALQAPSSFLPPSPSRPGLPFSPVQLRAVIQTRLGPEEPFASAGSPVFLEAPEPSPYAGLQPSESYSSCTAERGRAARWRTRGCIWPCPPSPDPSEPLQFPCAAWLGSM